MNKYHSKDHLKLKPLPRTFSTPHRKGNQCNPFILNSIRSFLWIKSWNRRFYWFIDLWGFSRQGRDCWQNIVQNWPNHTFQPWISPILWLTLLAHSLSSNLQNAVSKLRKCRESVKLEFLGILVLSLVVQSIIWPQ